MFNTLAYRVAISSIFFAAVTIFLGALLACQEDLKDEPESLPPGVVLQKVSTTELISKSICTDQLKAFTLLSNAANPLVDKSPDGLYHTKHVYRIYVLPNKTFTGTHSYKLFEASSGSAVEKANLVKLSGAWAEKDEQIILFGVGKLRRVKRLAQNQRVEDVKESQIELVPNSLPNQKTSDAETVKDIATVLTVENASVGPNDQKIEDICQGL